MDIPEDPQERKKWMMQVLQDYGRDFLIFEPEDQPNVFVAPEPEYRDLRSDNLDPRELRSCDTSGCKSTMRGQVRCPLFMHA